MRSLLRLRPYVAKYRSSFLIGIFFVLLTNVFTLLSPLVLKRAIDELRAGALTHSLVTYAGVIVTLATIQGIFRYGMRKVMIGASREIEYDLRNDLFSHIESLSLPFFERRNTGDLMARATNDLNAVRMFIGPAIMYIANTFFTVVIGVSLMMSIDWKLTLLAMIPFPLLSLAVNYLGSRLHTLYSRIQEQYSSITTHVQENISGIRVVKAFVREREEIRRFGILNREFIQRNMHMVRLWG
ncbi:MAG: ABC transporter ATP-binding protein, partial [Gemmatimonadetes bacterium]|nr:ABC transporter ATP-binding protein [Gemmatimonadota bacterium]